MRAIVLCSFIVAAALSLVAQTPVNRLVFDSPATGPTPKPVPTLLGTSRAPDGTTLGVNSQYLARNGKPWIPVMGEFHFSRYPQAYWEEEILKMKADGVQVIATYIFWIHHEEIQGQFDWSGQRDLRKFAILCANNGMLLYPRIGPWAHGEVRNGGLPDWLLKKSAVRENNPVYLAEVKRFYGQIGFQLHGLLWKDGGPVIGLQIENEYALNGPGQGREHLAALKQMAIESGLDVPLYTVTGWDNAVVPEDLFLPVYGGYPDAPWDESTGILPPAEVYAFRFSSRVTANMGAIGSSTIANAKHDAALRASVPFLTAEVGGGIEDTYHRRPLLSGDDIAAMVSVFIGSGANLLGYYMYHGGTNPEGKLTTLQESQRTNYPNDLPTKSYDFQAPLGEFGDRNPRLKSLRPMHYFLSDFAAELAPAAVIEPKQTPTGPEDFSVLRVSARLDGERGFVFVNNHVREHAMPAWPGTQFEFKLANKKILVPAAPLTVPANSYFIWPVNMDMDGITMSYATAQPILRMKKNRDTYLFFQPTSGVPAEFAFPAASRSAVHAERGTLVEEPGLFRIQGVNPGRDVAITVHGKSGVTCIVLLSAEDSANLWRVTIDGEDRLVLTGAQVFSDSKHLTLRQIGNPVFAAALFPPQRLTNGNKSLSQTAGKHDGIFRCFAWSVPVRKITPELLQTKAVGKARSPLLGPKASFRESAVAMTPEEASFSQAGEWRISLPRDSLNGLSDVFLKIHYQGDEARLLAGNLLLSDNFFNGAEWRVGLKRFFPNSGAGDFTLQVLPLQEKAPIFFEPGFAPVFERDRQAGSLQSVEALPEYEQRLELAP
jgi:hypothetical protein